LPGLVSLLIEEALINAEIPPNWNKRRRSRILAAGFTRNLAASVETAILMTVIAEPVFPISLVVWTARKILDYSP
jgi:hypothetical protein